MVLVGEFEVSWKYKSWYERGLFTNADHALWFKVFEEIPNAEERKILILVERFSMPVFEKIQAGCKEIFNKAGRPNLVSPPLLLEGGENSKNGFDWVNQVQKAINEFGIDRHSFVMAIGGGAFLDYCGFASAIAHRGIKFIRVPTTVLSMNDSGVGVKNAVNQFGKKNFTGTFMPPFAVLNDFDLLETLDRRNLLAGQAEAIKVGLIRDRFFFRWLEQNAQALIAGDKAALEKSIIDSARLHLNHITQGGDPFEFGSARPLDFGHWLAHKLEALHNFQILHGEAVAVGILVDSAYSFLMKWLPEPEFIRIKNLLQILGFSMHWLKELKDQEKLPLIFNGLEEFREHLGGKLTLTMLNGIGEGFEIHYIERQQMEKAIEMVLI